MTQYEHHVICTIIKALQAKRNRFGKLDIDTEETRRAAHEVSMLLRKYPQVPHGGEDRVDQAAMLLQCLVGQTPTSVYDM